MEAKEEGLPQLVVLGSSAGGIDALSAVIERLPATFPVPLVIAQHLDPRRPSHLAEILSRRSNIPVHGVEGPIAMAPGNAYILPADHEMEIRLGGIVGGTGDGQRPSPSIDRILVSAATAYGEGVTAVILSGSGSDGAYGARQVKAAGGTVVIQNPETAPYPSMPQAIAPSIVDIVADADAIGPLLEDLVAAPRMSRREDDEKRQLRAFLERLRERTGIDFGSYKRGTIVRRLHRRMLATGNPDLRSYSAYIEGHPEEYQRLAASFLIKVTEFFRDADLFDALRDELLPGLIEEARSRDRELRVWSAGCATGEEAYSLAILVAEALGDELPSFNVRIFATDVDADAVSFARRGTYAASSMAAVPEPLRERHFTKVGDHYEVSKHIRAMTVFGVHDLGQRAPFPRVDLALCRNVLIYFTAELQRRALQLFAFALRDGGSLVLGKAETTSPLPQHFALTNPRLRIYRRQGERVLIPPARFREPSPMPPLRLTVARRPGWGDLTSAAQEPARGSTISERAEQLLLRLPVGLVVVDRSYDVQIINAAARRLLEIHGQAIADDLVHLLDGPLGNAVKKAVDAVFRGQTRDPFVAALSAPTAEGQDVRSIELAVQALPSTPERGPVEHALIVATDVTAWTRGRSELESTVGHEQLERQSAVTQARELTRANTDLLDANQELTNANAELRTANEELLVATEEVQAATEEVETLNEELQATNEELETLNEELQATVEELNTTNDDLQARTIELQESALAVEHERETAEAERIRLLAILDAVDEPVLVVGRAGQIVKANRPFRLQVGAPETVDLLDPRGRPFDATKDPLRRAMAGPFEQAVRIGETRWIVQGQALNGVDGGFGALIFRPSKR